MVVLAWNFYKDIKKNNSNLSKNFINIKRIRKLIYIKSISKNYPKII